MSSDVNAASSSEVEALLQEDGASSEGRLSLIKEVEIPSRGVLYGDMLPDGRMKLSPMTTRQEKLIAGTTNRQEMIDRLIQQCLITKAVPYDEILVGDKFFLLFYLRGISYGFEYSFKHKCPSCGSVVAHSVDLPQGMTIRRLTDDTVEPFTVELSGCEKTVDLRLLRVKDERDIRSFTKRALSKTKGKSDGDVAYEYKLAKHIVAIDGKEVDILKALSFCETMLSSDSLIIRDAIDANDCGVDLNIEVECHMCGEYIETLMPFTAEFFRPKSA